MAFYLKLNLINITPWRVFLNLCGAKTRNGGICRRIAVRGKSRCRLHGGESTGPRTEEGRRAIAKANTRHGRYIGLRKRREIDKRYYAEIRRVMADAKEVGLIV